MVLEATAPYSSSSTCHVGTPSGNSRGGRSLAQHRGMENEVELISESNCGSLTTQCKVLNTSGLCSLSGRGNIEKVFSSLAREGGEGCMEGSFLGLESKGANSIRRAARRRRKY